MVGGFIFAALLTDGNVDDDDNGPGGGLMQPVYAPPICLTSKTNTPIIRGYYEPPF